MSKIKSLSLVLAIVLLMSVALPTSAAAETFSEQTSFDISLQKATAEDAPGNIEATISVKTDPSKLITTFGTTLVIDTNYIDLVDIDGNVMTNACKLDSKVLGADFPVTGVKIKSGKKTKSFSSMQGLSIASYNPNSKLMYVFVCGLNIGGIKIAEKSAVASFYLKAKNGDKIPESAVRTMRVEELGTSCRSKAVFVAEISSTTEVGDTACKVSLDVAEDLVDQSIVTEPVTEEPTTQTPTGEEPVSKEEQSTSQTTTAKEQPTKAVEQMSEKELEEELKEKTEIADSISVPEQAKQSTAYKKYEKAVQKAKKVLENKESTKEEKQQALKELREAEEELKEENPAIAEQIEKLEPTAPRKWLFIGIGGAVALGAIAIIIVLIVKNRKKKN